MECGYVVHAHTCTDEHTYTHTCTDVYIFAHITEDTKLNTHPHTYLYEIYPDTCAHT